MKPLTSRQLETVKMVASGVLNKEIAQKHGISVTSVDSQLLWIVKKLNKMKLAIKPRVFLTRYAVEKNLVKPIFASLLLLAMSAPAQISTTNLQVIWQLTTSNVMHTNDHAKNPFYLSSLPYKSSLKCVAVQATYTNATPYQFLITSNGGVNWEHASVCARSEDTNDIYWRSCITLPCPIRLYTNGSNDWGVWLKPL